MKNVYLSILSLLMASGIYAQEPFSYDLLYDGSNPWQLNAFQFHEGGNGWAFQNSGLSGSSTSRPYFTSDYGETWSGTNLGLDFSNFLINYHGPHADSTFAYFQNTSNGSISVDLTTDQGSSWEEKVVLSFDGYTYYTSFGAKMTSGSGVVCGHATLESTEDNEPYAMPWVATNDGADALSLRSTIPYEFEQVDFIEFVNPQVGYIRIDDGNSGDEADEFLRTTDGGQTWTNIFHGEMTSISVVDELTVYGSVDDLIYKTVDGGANWTTSDINNRTYHNVYTGDQSDTEEIVDISLMDFYDVNNGVIAGRSGTSTVYFIRTSDGAQSFYQDSISIDVPNFNGSGSGDVLQVQMLTPQDLFCAHTGHILYSEGDGSVNISETDISANIQVYPNPSTGFFQIKADTKVEEIQLSNSNGQVLETIVQPSGNQNFSHLSPGIYFLRLRTLNGIVVKRVMIE